MQKRGSRILLYLMYICGVTPSLLKIARSAPQTRAKRGKKKITLFSLLRTIKQRKKKSKYPYKKWYINFLTNKALQDQ